MIVMAIILLMLLIYMNITIKVIPKNIVIHRLTGDGAKRILIAPLWTADKKRVWNDMNKYFCEHDVKQGEPTPDCRGA